MLQGITNWGDIPKTKDFWAKFRRNMKWHNVEETMADHVTYKTYCGITIKSYSFETNELENLLFWNSDVIPVTHMDHETICPICKAHHLINMI